MASDLPGQDGFAQLAPQAALASLGLVEQQVASDLLSDGAAACQGLTAAQVDPHGAQDPFQVDARIVIKTTILGGDGSLAQGSWKRLQRQDSVPPAVLSQHFIEQAPIPVGNAHAG